MCNHKVDPLSYKSPGNFTAQSDAGLRKIAKDGRSSVSARAQNLTKRIEALERFHAALWGENNAAEQDPCSLLSHCLSTSSGYAGWLRLDDLYRMLENVHQRLGDLEDASGRSHERLSALEGAGVKESTRQPDTSGKLPQHNYDAGQLPGRPHFSSLPPGFDPPDEYPACGDPRDAGE